MSAPLVLHDAAMDAGLGLHGARELALWAMVSGGDLGALSWMVLSSTVALVHGVQACSRSSSRSGLRAWDGGWSTTWSLCGRSGLMPWSLFWCRDGARIGTATSRSRWSTTHSGTQSRRGAWSAAGSFWSNA